MKFIPALAAAMLAFPAHAESLRFQERIEERIFCFQLPSPPRTFCDSVAAYSFHASGQLKLPGFARASFDRFSSFHFAVGRRTFQFSGRDAVQLTPTLAAFRFVRNEEGDITRNQIIFSKNGDVLRVTAFSDIPVGTAGVPGSATVGASLSLSARVGDTHENFSLARNLSHRGRTLVIPTNAPGFSDYNIWIANGAADFTRPRIRIIQPTRRTRLTESTVTVSGTARDNVSVTNVSYRLGEGEWITATGTTNWSATIMLTQPETLFQAVSTDQEGQQSAIASRKLRLEP